MIRHLTPPTAPSRPAEFTTRRHVLRLLGGLGLAATGATVFGPAPAAAASLSAALLEISVREPSVNEKARGQFDSPFDNPLIEQAIIRVTTTINFSADDLRAMRDGQKFRLACEVWENDNNNQAPEPGIDQFVFVFPRKVFPKSAGNLPARKQTVSFQTTVERSLLDLDQPNPNGDEIVALLILTSPSGLQQRLATNMVKLCPCQP